MRLQNQRRRALCRLTGLLLVLAGWFFAHWWFYKLGPVRRTSDPQWCSSHSQQEYWREVQTGIYRGVWSHGDGFAVGRYRDKAWAEWIMNHVEAGASMGCLGARLCHSATAMRFITNQDAGESADGWLVWWEKNKSKSQEQWIADGFAQRGVKIDVPPAPEHTLPLLALLGNRETKESAAVPEEVKYNAFRWLRDSGFDPVAFILSDRTISGDTERGLLEYAKQLRHYLEEIRVGILPLRATDESGESHCLPVLLTRAFQIKAYMLIFAPLALGTALPAWSFCKGRTSTPPTLSSQAVDRRPAS